MGPKCPKNQCPYCGVYHSNVVQHVKERHLAKREQCPTCHTTFTRRTSLIRHLNHSCKSLQYTLDTIK
ncbi:hypothetical protein LOTGIDRAFT_117303 [Lottia gigantea]|uniref:C2H2-type domain-containing protein n=1 Tax=Lottia gigantea TaxID=225164 RepID=V4AJT2_LOTGI|nr:hypothetical protein LOTGIDRAFT_117303 [Lottia gigantea]ESO94980.1 hypothetical protein LOTGIDRAFT_117303 [Lottia gigantea]